MLKHSFDSPARRCRRSKQRSKSQSSEVSSISGGDGGGVGGGSSSRGTIDDDIDNGDDNYACFPFNWQSTHQVTHQQQHQQDDEGDDDDENDDDDDGGGGGGGGGNHHRQGNIRFRSRAAAACDAVKMTRRRPPSGAPSVDLSISTGSVRRWNSFHSTRGECHPNKFRRDRKSASPSIDGGSTGCLGGRRTAGSSPMRHGGGDGSVSALMLPPPRRYKSLAAGGSCELAAALFNEVATARGATGRRRVTTPMVLEAHW